MIRRRREIFYKQTLRFLLLFLLSGLFFQLKAQVDTEFWFAVPEISYRDGTGGTPGTLRLATLKLEATVTISMPANRYDPDTNPTGFQDIVVDIPANDDAAVDLTHLLDDAANPGRVLLENQPLNAEGINNFGLYIRSTNMINCYWEINDRYGSDLWTLKGTNGMGTLFYTPFQTEYNNLATLPGHPRYYSAIDVVATEDDTEVTFTLPPGIAASYGKPLSSIPPGGSETITLNEGQTFSLFPFNYSLLGSRRLAGTRVESTAPISVTVKDDMISTGSKGSPVIGDQLVPVDIIGDNYIVPDMWNPNHIYVVATEDNTNIYVTDVANNPIGGAAIYATLNRGDQVMVDVPTGSQYARITSRVNDTDPPKPIYVFQVGIANQTRAGALVPAIGCTGNTQLAFTRARDENRFNFFLITERGHEDDFLIDGVSEPTIIDPGAFEELAGSNGWVACMTNSIPISKISQGQHLVENTGGIFHLAILNGFTGAGQGGLYYGYYSDFGGLNIGANVAGTNSWFVRACHGDSVRLNAFGGTTYRWSPDTYLDDANLQLPTAINLPAGTHQYTVTVSGACGTDSEDLFVTVAPPVVAHMETSVASGCAILDVEFEDLSEGTFEWEYDLGDGSPLMTYDLDPETPAPFPPDPFVFTNTYENTTDEPLEYTATLVARNSSGCADIQTRTITVYPEIESRFSVNDDEGCDPLEVEFTNESVGDTATWLWEFGDGGSSIAKDPVHLYRNILNPDDTTFQARLIAISPYLCRDTASHPITVSPYIEASFAYDTVAECAPHEIIITDQSFGADSYFWDFGDDSTSQSAGPVIRHTYQNKTDFPVTYTITLRVENEEGCSHQVQREVTVYPEVTAGFIANPTEACSPAEFVFLNTSVGGAGSDSLSYYWEFGDGGSSTEAHPIHRYDRNMLRHDTVFTVMLVATTTEFCRDTFIQDVVLHPYIEAAFTVDDVVGCHPFDVVVHNESMGVDFYDWDFGDGIGVSNSDADTLFYTYENVGAESEVYPLTLFVRNEEGCVDTMIRNVTVHPEISAIFSVDRPSGCHPLTVTFSNTSVNADAYLWDFGDGAASVERAPVHTFTNFGNSDTTYYVTLTTSTSDGECVKQARWPIIVYPQVVSEFTFPQAQGCGPFEVTFQNLSIGGTSFTWDFGDGNSIQTDSSDSQTYVFVNSDTEHTREFLVSLITENDFGCSDTVTKPVQVYPGIDALFDPPDTAGCHPFDLEFNNLSSSSDGQTFVWDFGDGSTSNAFEPVHRFTNTGTIDSVYTVKLMAMAGNNICTDSFFIDVTVHPYVQANFVIPDGLNCTPFDVLIHNASVNASIFRWDFGDGHDTITFDTQSISHTYINPLYNNQLELDITLEAENYAGCTDVISRSIRVEPDIYMRLNPSQTAGCHPLEVDFTNMSQGGHIYHWDFGNGTTVQDYHTSMVFTNFSERDTTYRVWLKATASNLVCMDSMYVDILVHPYISADFTFQEQVHCTPSPVTFHNASVGGSSFTWDFGDQSDSIIFNGDSIIHSFTNNNYESFGMYQVRLSARNDAGCTSEMVRPVEVYPAIEASFRADVIEGCHPLTVDFSNRSRGGYIYSWDFGEGATSEADAPAHIFTNYTGETITRTVSLRATSQFDCTSEITGEITIHPKPVARFETPSIIDCAPFPVSFTNTSLHADNYSWDMGEGTLVQTSTQDLLTHEFDNDQADIATFGIRMVASTDFGCMDTVEQDIYVYPRTHAGFSVNEGDCSPFYAYFMNESVRGETYRWDFGDGTGASTTDPSNLYFNHSGEDVTFNISLTSISQHGCTDIFTDSIRVYAQPNVEFMASPTHQMYPSSTVAYTNWSNEGYWDYQWDMGDGFTTSLRDPADHQYDTWGEYTISLVAATPYCSDSVSHSIRILAAAPVAAFDTILGACAPYTVQFINNSIFGESYYWDFDDGTTSTEFSPVHTFEDYGYYNVKLTVSGQGGEEYAYRQVEVYRVPEADFRVSHQVVMLPDDEMWIFNLSKYGETYRWDFGDGTTSSEEVPIHQYTEIGIYDISLEVWSEHGCYDSIVKPAAIRVDAAGHIKFPNAFKPHMHGGNGGYYDLNEAETNQIFHPVWEGVDIYELQIYNRWGERLFTSNDVNIGWDGYHKGDLCAQDVYVWICNGFFINGEAFNLKGDVTLIHHDKSLDNQ